MAQRPAGHPSYVPSSAAVCIEAVAPDERSFRYDSASAPPRAAAFASNVVQGKTYDLASSPHCGYLFYDVRTGACARLGPGPARRSHRGCPRSVGWLSSGLRGSGTAEQGEAQAGSAQLELALPSQLDIHQARAEEATQ